MGFDRLGLEYAFNYWHAGIPACIGACFRAGRARPFC
jgi:hypothetical protein